MGCTTCTSKMEFNNNNSKNEVKNYNDRDADSKKLEKDNNSGLPKTPRTLSKKNKKNVDEILSFFSTTPSCNSI